MIQNFLEKIIDKLDDGNAVQMHNDINDRLLEYQDKGWIDDYERDALRHYYTIQALAEEYGPTVAWLAGVIHEDAGYGLLYPEDSEEYKFTKADLYNNNIALEMYDKLPEGKNPLQDLYLADSPERLKMPLAFLEIVDLDEDTRLPIGSDVPPDEPPPQSKFNLGYHPELDRNR